MKFEVPASVSNEALVSLETGNYELEDFKTSVVDRVESWHHTPTSKRELRSTGGT